MHHWSLQTAMGAWFFHPGHRKLQGIRLTHQPSPWMEDYGSLLLTAFTGPLLVPLDHQASAYRMVELHPHHLHVALLRYGIEIEMSPTERGALFVFTCGGADPLNIRLAFAAAHSVSGTEQPDVFTGVSRDQHGGVAGDFGLRFAAQFSPAPAHWSSGPDGAVMTFPPEVGRVELRIAGSFISTEQARVTLARELAGRDLPGLVADGAGRWSELLDRVTLRSPEPALARTFSSCLYRCLLFPRFLHEIAEDGSQVHYSPYDGLLHNGPLCADNGFWDTYRTLYPLLGLLYPDVLRTMMEGWLNACREAGWAPTWPSPGGRSCMIGSHFDVVVADAIARGVTDWNIEEAFLYLWRDATEHSAQTCYGRIGLREYEQLGFLPCDSYRHSVAATLDYAYDDACIARVARFLGKTKEAAILERRSMNYRNVFDPTVGFMRARRADGAWQEPFHPFEWGGAYIEGSAWQFCLHVPHDTAGLIGLYGGPGRLEAKLDAMLQSPARFSIGDYPCEIHEMTEMAMAGFGQYAHSNQPVHQFLPLYAVVGRPDKAEAWIHRVARELYSPDVFPGDEDNGEMAAWFVFACLGIFPHCPGFPGWFRFRPLIDTHRFPLG